MYIKMHGPAFDNSGKITETDVHVDNVAAFKRAGWVEGEMEKTEPVKKVETPEPDSTTPKRCAFIKKDGEQCSNDAVKDSDYCWVKTHK